MEIIDYLLKIKCQDKVSGLIDAAKFPGIAQASRHKWKSKANSTLRENCCQCAKKAVLK